jgi:pimeloyl-ACP methyl ester carboxylesterase
MPKHVVTVHGIDTDGSWQDRVEAVLTPHFECVKIRHEDYRRFGAIRLSFGSAWLALFAVGLSLLCVVAQLFFCSRILALCAISLLLAVVAFGVVLAKRKRSSALNEFKEQVDSRVAFAIAPHLIAHSFGTFLAGNSLLKFPSLRFDRVVFAGCVLPRSYAWTRVLAANPNAFNQLRNEVAARDWVPLGADVLRFLLVPGFGSAGALGFSEQPGVVHTVGVPNQTCGQCARLSDGTKIHNVVFAEYAHSDHFVGLGHAESWLPYLWGIDPSEFSLLMEMCVLAVDLEERNDLVSLEIVESELRERPWKWAAGMALEEFVWRQVEAMSGTAVRDRYFASVVSRAVRLFWHAVRLAQQEQRKATKSAVIVRRLHPRFAVCAAVISVLEGES